MGTPPDILEKLPALQPLKDHAKEAGIFLDLDGTLAELVDLPEAVRFPHATRDLLRTLRSRFRSVVIISGRSAHSLETIVQLPELTYVGNHGLEIVANGQRRVLLPEPHVSRMRAIEGMLPDLIEADGVALELKELSHAIHYRGAPDPQGARRDILRALASLDLQEVRILEGKFLIQIRPDAGLDKGTAVAQLVNERGLRFLLYAGDDTTDLDGFRAVDEFTAEGGGAGYRVAVSYPDTPAALLAAADFSVPGIEGMRVVLGWMAA
ncbi:MAG: trehalose-phosphatase [Thermoplasmata archaeon]